MAEAWAVGMSRASTCKEIPTGGFDVYILALHSPINLQWPYLSLQLICYRHFKLSP